MSESSNDDERAASQAYESSAATLFDGEEYVRWAYRLLLGREPENLEAVQSNPFKNHRQLLVQYFLNSHEFKQNYEKLPITYKDKLAALADYPYASWNRDAVAFIHLPKTAGTTLHSLLSACFSKGRICPQRLNALHSYSPAELTRYDFYSGHFDYFSLRFIPRQRVRCISMFRDPYQRLISSYRFYKSHPTSNEFADDIDIKLANELSAEEFFEHKNIICSTYTNNSYLFYFGSSSHDHATFNALAGTRSPIRGPAPVDRHAAADSLAADEFCVPILARARQRILDLDAIGLTERFQDSVETIFTTLGFPIPETIAPDMVTDELPASDARFSPVPPVTMTARLSRALEPLTKYDRILYDVAKREFERRRAAAPNAT
jgi:hypothetical protein